MFFMGSYLPSDEFIAWVFQSSRWLLEQLGGWEQFRDRPLILPEPEFYPRRSGDGHDFAAELFGLTLRHAGMAGWPCILDPQEDLDMGSMMGGLPYSYSSAGAAGTFQSLAGGVTAITYAAKDEANPVALIATFAHELSHCLLDRVKAEPPGGDGAREPLTDLCAGFLGFGIFQCNSALQVVSTRTRRGGRVSREMVGFSARRKGYLDEKQLAYVLGLFCALRGIPVEPVRRRLATNPAAYLKAAGKDLAKRAAQVEALRAVSAGSPWPPNPTPPGLAEEVWLHLGQGWARLRREEWAAAVESFTQALAGGEVAAAYEGRGWAYQLLGQETQSRADMDRLVEIAADREQALLKRAWLASDRGDHRAAIADADRVLGQNPSHPQALIQRGFASASLQEYEAAVRDAEAVLAGDPQDPAARNLRALALLALGRSAEALADVETLIGQRPADSKLLLLRGMAQARLGRLEEAEQALVLGLEDDPFDLSFLVELAKVRACLGNWDAVLRDCQAIFELEPAHRFAHLLQAYVWVRTGRPAEALQECASQAEALQDCAAFHWLQALALEGVGGVQGSLTAQAERALAVRLNGQILEALQDGGTGKTDGPGYGVLDLLGELQDYGRSRCS